MTYMHLGQESDNMKRVTGLPAALTPLAASIHADNIAAGWWKQERGERQPYQKDYPLRTVPRNIGELLCLVHSEISEADEGLMLNLADDKLPHRQMFEVELGDASIRVLDILGYYGTDIDEVRNNADPLPLPDFGTRAWIRLMHRTVSAAMEGFRKGDEARGTGELVKLLGIIHFAAIKCRLDLTGAIAEKRAYNSQRADHKPENRAAAGGKQF